MNEKKMLNYYQDRFAEYGEDEKSLGWTKSKQSLRFFQLIKNFHLENANLTDIGCGFGDLYGYLSRGGIKLDRYLGVDIVPEFVEIAKRRYPDDWARFLLANYLDLESIGADCTVASGVFGYRLFDKDEDQYAYVGKVFRKAFEESSQGIAFDFLSDKTDFYSGKSDFHASPSTVLEIAYGLSRNVILDNSCMPFEFTLTVFKNDSFLKETTVFDKFLKERKAE